MEKLGFKFEFDFERAEITQKETIEDGYFGRPYVGQLKVLM